MATEKGVWNVQEVRDKQLLGEWSYDGAGQLWTTGWNIYGALGLNLQFKYHHQLKCLELIGMKYLTLNNMVEHLE